MAYDKNSNLIRDFFHYLALQNRAFTVEAFVEITLLICIVTSVVLTIVVRSALQSLCDF